LLVDVVVVGPTVLGTLFDHRTPFSVFQRWSSSNSCEFSIVVRNRKLIRSSVEDC